MDIEEAFQRMVNSAELDDTPRQAHRRKLREQVLTEFEASRESVRIEPRIRPLVIIRRLFRWPAAAAAAVLISLASAGWFFLGGGTSLTLADVQAAIDKTTWVHLTYDNSTGGDIQEQWLCPAQGIIFVKRTDGDVVFINEVKNVRLWYEKKANVIAEDTPTINMDGKVPEYKPQPTWLAALGVSVGISGEYKTPDDLWQTGVVDKQPDGREMVRFDLKYKNALGEYSIDRQVWVDPRTRLPVRMCQRLQLGNRKDVAQEWVTGTFDFPAQGPADIYALGVPTDAAIVKTDPTHMPDDVKTILAKAAAARNAFPKRYLAVVWTNDLDAEIDVAYRDMDRYSSSRYFSLDSAKYHLSIPASADAVLAWVQTQTPMSITLFANNVAYHRSNDYPADVPAVRNKPTLTASRITAEEYFRTDRNPPADDQWPTFNIGGPLEIERNSSEAPAGCITLRSQSGNYRTEYHLDPAKDYICVKHVRWQKKDGRFQKDWESYLYNFTCLSSRQWYAQRRVLISYGESNISYSVSSWNTEVRLLKEDQIQPGIFNIEKLKEGVEIQVN